MEMGMYISADKKDLNGTLETVSKDFFKGNSLFGQYSESRAMFKVTGEVKRFLNALGYDLMAPIVIPPSQLLQLYIDLWELDYMDYGSEATFYALNQFIGICWVKQFYICIS